MTTTGRLPAARGPLSRAVLDLLLDGTPLPDACLADSSAEPRSDDEALALYLLNELEWRTLPVRPDASDDLAVLTLRHVLEDRLEQRLRARVGVPEDVSPEQTVVALREMIDGFDGPSLSGWVEEHAELWHVREFAIHRSAYQLKEADQHSFGMARLPSGLAKSAMVEIQTDEYGEGRPGASHAELFARTMELLDLDPGYGAYVDRIPGTTLTTVNLLSLLTMRPRLVAASVGHLAVFEMTSVTPMSRYARAVRRVLGGAAGEEAARFYDVHVVADTHHAKLAEHMVRELVRQDPAASSQVLLGALALLEVERCFATEVLGCWLRGRSSLRPVTELLPPDVVTAVGAVELHGVADVYGARTLQAVHEPSRS